MKFNMVKILIVEDEIDICETYTDILEAAGHSVQTVDRASAAYMCLPKLRPDIVLVDMQLPGESGMFVVAFIRRYPRLSETKIAIVSGHPEMAVRAVQEYGADAFLNKPISPEQLRAMVQTFCPPVLDEC